MTPAESSNLLREFVVHELFASMVARINGADADMRLDFAVGQLIGVAFPRHIFRIEPIASASTDELINSLGPVIEHHLRR